MSFHPPEDLTSAQEMVRERIIVALDHRELAEALELVEMLGERIRYYKVGYRLFFKYGPTILDALGERGAKIFLDLKLYDIPSVVGEACKNIASHEGVFLTTVHAGGGSEMVREALRGVKAGRPEEPPAVVAVTALTSFSSRDLPEVGVNANVAEWAARLADVALSAGADGLVSSAREVPSFRQTYGQKPLLVTPGIRLENVRIAGDDQERTVTPLEALKKGTSMLVIGRPVYQAPDPVAVFDVIADSLLAD